MRGRTWTLAALPLLSGCVATIAPMPAAQYCPQAPPCAQAQASRPAALPSQPAVEDVPAIEVPTPVPSVGPSRRRLSGPSRYCAVEEAP
jgi:hypothetical protein